MTYQFLFTRGIPAINLQNAALLRLTPATGCAQEDAWKRFRRAITRWLIETDRGRDAWSWSHQDFNIGDALMFDIEADAAFLALAEAEGLLAVAVQSLNIDTEWRDYDLVLMDRALLPKHRWLVHVHALVPPDELHELDRGVAGDHYLDAVDEEDALDNFHWTTPIKVLDHFEITAEPAPENG